MPRGYKSWMPHRPNISAAWAATHGGTGSPGGNAGAFDPAALITGLIPGGGPAVDIAKAAIQGATNALQPVSPETEARFAQLMAGWSAIELRVTSLPTNGLPDVGNVLAAYKSWTAFRDAWLQGRKDGAQLPAQEGALKRTAGILDKAPAATALPPLASPGPSRPIRVPSKPNHGFLAVGAAVLVGGAVAVTLLLKGK